jgi:hypothetical protein
MFRIAQTPTFWTTVKVEVVPEEGGKRVFDWQQQFPRLTTDEYKKFTDWINKGPAEDNEIVRVLLTGTWKRHVYPDADPNDQNDDKAKLVRMKWKGVGDEKDNPLDPTDGNIDALLNGTVGLGGVIVKAFFSELTKAAGKNW